MTAVGYIKAAQQLLAERADPDEIALMLDDALAVIRATPDHEQTERDDERRESRV